MTIRNKISWSGSVVALLCLAVVPVVYGQGVGRMPFGGELRGITQFTGAVVCLDCTLEEARNTQQHPGDLYVLKYPEGQVVMRVDSFYDSAEHRRWESIVGLSHQLWARASDRVFDELTAERNLFKEMTVTGLLRSNGTFDIDKVQVVG